MTGLSARHRPGSRVVATVVVLLGAAVVVLASGRAWAQTTVVGLPGPDLVTTDGRAVAPGASALALVAGAGAIVLATSGRVLRMIVAGLLVLAGAGVVAVTLGVLADPAGMLEPAVAKATGTTGGSLAFAADATVWPVLSAAGGAAVAVGGLLALVRGRRWTGPARRFDRATDASAPDGEVTAFAQGTKVTGRSPRNGGEPVRSGKDERLDAWDRLSAGDDPTD